ncbi:hypothetical protein EBZ80_21075 [bacterium]|nr:hypothetical protein [bacterium]
MDLNKEMSEPPMSTCVFPLYDMVCTRLGETPIAPLNDEEQASLVANVKALDSMGQELVFALIRYHQLRVSGESMMEAPFGMRKMKNGEHRVDVRNLPPSLQHVLTHFVKIHQQGSST